jgi:outer membrane protein assembly factor BamB
MLEAYLKQTVRRTIAKTEWHSDPNLFQEELKATETRVFNEKEMTRIIRRTLKTLFLLCLITVVLTTRPAKAGAIDNVGATGSADSWSMFRSDANHTGNSSSHTPSNNSIAWKYQTGSLIASSPSIVDSKVYVGSLDSNVYCLDSLTGGAIWRYRTGAGVDSSPAIVNGSVFIGSTFPDFHVYCLNATTGELIWRFQTGDRVDSSPCVANNRVYVGSSDGYVYCLNASTGNLIWRYSAGAGIDSSPGIAEGRVYVGSYDGHVYCLDDLTGAFIWAYQTDAGIVVSSPTIADGSVYIGSEDHYVYSLNASTGSLIWRFQTGDMIMSSPAIAYGSIYIGSSDHHIYSLNASTGELTWSFQTSDIVLESSPAVAGDQIFIGSWDGYLYCLNATTGALVWRFKTGGSLVSSPAVAAGQVFIGSYDHYVYSFGPPISFHDISIISLKTSKTVVGQGFSLFAEVTVENRGTFQESFNVTLCANVSVVQTKNVTIESGASAVIALTWNTTGFIKGTYIISANVSQIPYAPYTADKSLQGGIVIVTIPGDINGDGRVAGADLNILGLNWGLIGSHIINPNADVTGIGRVGGAALNQLGLHWG